MLAVCGVAVTEHIGDHLVKHLQHEVWIYALVSRFILGIQCII